MGGDLSKAAQQVEMLELARPVVEDAGYAHYAALVEKGQLEQGANLTGIPPA